jgi:transposase, IS5 family
MQTHFTSYFIEERIKASDSPLSKIEAMLDWHRIRRLLRKVRPESPEVGGHPSYDEVSMFRAILIQRMYNLSDYQLEAQLKDRLSFMHFCGWALESNIPDHSTICRFRQRLIAAELDRKLFDDINRQLQSRGIVIRNGSIVDATLVDSHARPRHQEVVEYEPTGDEEVKPAEKKPVLKVEESKDPDARWLKRGKRCIYGYKAHIAVDAEQGLVQAIEGTPANVPDINEFDVLLNQLDLVEGSPVLGDKGYSSEKNRQMIKSRGLFPAIMYKKPKGKEMNPTLTSWNRIISRTRYKVERTFGGFHRHLGFDRTPYLGLRKTQYYFRMGAMAYNLNRCLKLPIIQPE